MEGLIGERPFAKKTNYEAFTNSFNKTEVNNGEELKVESDLEDLKSTIKTEVETEEEANSNTKEPVEESEKEV